MVNKVAVILVGGIVLVGVVVIGGVAALVLGGGGSAGQATDTPIAATPLPSPGATATATPTATAIPTATATVTRSPTPTATATPTVTATPTATPQPTVFPNDFDKGEIELLVAQMVNERRQDADLDPLRLDGSLANDVTGMARNHSETMAEQGEAAHVFDNNTSANRYRKNDLYSNCQWIRPGEEAFARPDANGIDKSQNGFEAVARTIAGREYESEVTGEARFNGDERDVAEAVVQQWWNTSIPPYSERLTLPNARYLGVGVEITQFGEVYVTANLC